MINTFVEYNSPNDIYFHHSVSTSANFTSFLRPPEVHLQCELLLLISGIVEYKIDGETYPLKPGDIIVLNKNESHSIFVDLKEPFERMVFQFPPKFIPTLVDLAPLEPFNTAKSFLHVIPRTFVEKTKIRKILLSIKNVCSKPNRLTDLQLLSFTFALLKELHDARERMQKKPASIANNANAQVKFSKRCTDYINQNIFTRLTAKDVAQQMHVCESHLHHLFRKEMGMSVHTYILNQKMQTAALMLTEGKSPLETSEALGYEYYSTFFNNFHYYFGYTPKEHERYQHITLPKITKGKPRISDRIKQSLTPTPPTEND